VSGEIKLLEIDLERLGATEVQRTRLLGDVPRARAALAKASEAGAKNPLSYALAVFNSQAFSPAGAKPRHDTNRSVSVDCQTCGGDRMVVYHTRPNYTTGWMAERGLEAVGEVEEWAPCPDCNAEANTRREHFRSPDPARVRERLTR
jgi:hypothetical protein